MCSMRCAVAGGAVSGCAALRLAALPSSALPGRLPCCSLLPTSGRQHLQVPPHVCAAGDARVRRFHMESQAGWHVLPERAQRLDH